MAVTFTSHGYDTTSGNPYTEIAWADAHPYIGSAQYGVRSASDWKVTAVTGADRTVSIAPGFGWGSGVTDQTTANETIQLDPITSGSRWDMIAVRRDWTPTSGESKFVKINGGATAAIPAGRLVTPGQIDDQPLALVKVTAGLTQPGPIIDIRCWATNGGMVAADETAKSYLNRLGTVVWIDDAVWRYQPGLNDVPEWKLNQFFNPINFGEPSELTGMYSGWVRLYTAGNRRPRVWSTDGVTAHISGVVQFQPGGGANIVTIPAAFIPAGGSDLTYVGTTLASNGSADPVNGAVIALGIEGTALKLVYQSKALAAGSLVPLTGSWAIRE